MSRRDARDRVRIDIEDGGRTDDPGYKTHVACYRRWCLANGVLAEPPQPPWPEQYPGPTKVVMAFLHSEYLAEEIPRWSSNVVAGLIRDVTTELRRLGHGDDLDMESLGRYRSWVAKQLGATRLRPVDALTKEQVQAMPARAEQGVHAISARTLRLRGIIAAAEALRVDPTLPLGVVQGLHRSAFVVRPDGVLITVDPHAPQSVPRQRCQFPGGCARLVPPRTASSRGKAMYCGQRDLKTGRMHDAKVAWCVREAGLVAELVPAEITCATTADLSADLTAEKVGKGIRVTPKKRPPRHLLDAERLPNMYVALVAALQAAGDAEFPLLPPTDEGSHCTAVERLRRDSQSLFSAWSRAFPTRAPKQENGRRTPVAELRRQIATGPPTERVWWLAQVDKWLWMRRRDAAYIFAGIATARRHIELERATLGDLTPIDAGYEYVIRDHKGNRLARNFGGKEVVLTRIIGHLADNPADCTDHCPACRMRDHLEVRSRSGAVDADPLFIGLHGTVLGLAGGTYVLKAQAQLVEDLDYNPDGTPRSISTRTLRVTGATLARQGGMTYREIADEVTGHRSEDQAALYVRRHDASAVGLVLSLDGSRPAAE